MHEGNTSRYPSKKVNKSLPGAMVLRAIFIISGSQKETLQVLLTQVQFLIKHITHNTIVYLCCGVTVLSKQTKCVKAYFQFYGEKCQGETDANKQQEEKCMRGRELSGTYFCIFSSLLGHVSV